MSVFKLNHQQINQILYIIGSRLVGLLQYSIKLHLLFLLTTCSKEARGKVETKKVSGGYPQTIFVRGDETIP